MRCEIKEGDQIEGLLNDLCLYFLKKDFTGAEFYGSGLGTTSQNEFNLRISR